MILTIALLANAQADIIQFNLRLKSLTDYSSDTIVEKDSVKLEYLMLLTDKANTQKVYVYLGGQEDKTDLDSVMFNITNNNGTYYAISSELGSYEIVGRSLVFEKTYLLADIPKTYWGTVFLVNNNNEESEKIYNRNTLPQ